jgi:peroxiredoxin
MVLPDLDGVLRPLEEIWAKGCALLLIGHRNCKTTRQTIPFVDRIYRRRGAGHSVLVVLEDDVETVRTLITDQGLEVPIHLEPDPYPLAAALGLVAVPTLFLIERDGTIVKVTEAFNRADLEEYAKRLGNESPLFTPEDKAPATKPGCIPKEPSAS